MDSDSMVGTADMVGRLGRMDKLGKMGTGNVGVVFCDVSHNCHNRNHRLYHIDYNQIVSLLFPPLISI